MRMRATAVLVIVPFSTACALKEWHSVPVTPQTAADSLAPGRLVRISTSASLVTLRVVRFVYPYVEGIPEPGSGEVELPIGRTTAEVRTTGPRGTVYAALLPDAGGLAPERLANQDIQFSTPEKTRLALHVRALDEGVVRGVPIACWGEPAGRCTATILVDLREASWIDRRAPDRNGIVGTVALAATAVLLAAFVRAFLKALS